jgi:hypothetical protein
MRVWVGFDGQELGGKMVQIDPLEFLKAVYMDENLPLSVRMRAAVEVLPFTHPKLAVTAVINEQNFAEVLDRRLKRLEKMRNGNGGVIEAKPRPTVETKQPLPRINDRRFRRI